MAYRNSSDKYNDRNGSSPELKSGGYQGYDNASSNYDQQ